MNFDRSILSTPIANGTFIVFDIETTGGNPEKNGITEISALKVSNFEVTDEFYSLVNPKIPIPPIVRRMTGINNNMLKNSPTIDQVMPDFVDFIGEHTLVSHNTIGDMKFLQYFSEKVTGKDLANFYLCTHLLVEKLFPETPDKSLKGLAKYFEYSFDEVHRAKADALLTLSLFRTISEKLDERNITELEQAVRLQGDFDSAVRIGWGIEDKSFKNVPNGPGVFYVFDKERKLLFSSSAMNLSREVNKLRNFNQVPKQLLRTILHGFDLKTERFENPFSAMMHECRVSESHSLSFDPIYWHQRQIFAINISEDAELIKLSYGPINKGTTASYGPINDRKAAYSILKDLSEAFGAEFSKKGFVTERKHLQLVSDVLSFSIKQRLKKIKRQRLSPTNIINRDKRRALAAELKICRNLVSTQLEKPLTSLLDISGIIVVPGEGSNSWSLYHVVNGKAEGNQTIRGDFKNKLSTAGFGRRLQEAISEKQKISEALTDHTSRVSNLTLWWIHYGAKNTPGEFIPITELV